MTTGIGIDSTDVRALASAGVLTPGYLLLVGRQLDVVE
jgi:hypothetical protein